jgi:hypothetical protein
MSPSTLYGPSTDDEGDDDVKDDGAGGTTADSIGLSPFPLLTDAIRIGVSSICTALTVFASVARSKSKSRKLENFHNLHSDFRQF